MHDELEQGRASWTDLHAAAADGDGARVGRLVQQGADPFALTKDKARPSDLAAAFGHSELANRLRAVEQERKRAG